MNRTHADRIAWFIYERENAHAKAAYYKRVAYLEQVRNCVNCGGHNGDWWRGDKCVDCRGQQQLKENKG